MAAGSDRRPGLASGCGADNGAYENKSGEQRPAGDRLDTSSRVPV
jgi:hypothetical protein